MTEHTHTDEEISEVDQALDRTNDIFESLIVPADEAGIIILHFLWGRIARQLFAEGDTHEELQQELTRVLNDEAEEHICQDCLDAAEAHGLSPVEALAEARKMTPIGEAFEK